MGGASFVGRVVSNRMQKTVVVAVDYVVWRPKLKVYEKRTHKHFAHDENQECNIGDTVKILRTRRLSKHKSYMVGRVLRRVNVYTPEVGAAAVEAALADRQNRKSRVELAGEQYQLAQQRLEKLKQLQESYEQRAAAVGLVAERSGSSSSTDSNNSNSSTSEQSRT